MTTAPEPLNATITGGTITTDDTQPITFTTSILGYEGDTLYCKLLVSDFTLVVLIDNDGPNSLGPFKLTKMPDKVSVIVRSQALSAMWVGVLGTPYSGDELEFAVNISPDMRYVSFAIRPPRIPQPGSVSTNGDPSLLGPGSPATVRADAGSVVSDAALGYIAVEMEEEPHDIQLFFIENPPTITNYQRLTTATIIPPAQPPGSIGGPMGIQLTS
jgi:hypothetical protein